MKKNGLILALAATLALPIFAATQAFDSQAAIRQVKPEWHEKDAATRCADLIGKPALLEGKDWMNSKELSMDKLKGKWVLLDFWATWCGPCKAAFPHNNAIAEKYKDKLVFIGLCHPQGGETMKELATELGAKYPIALDAAGKLIDHYKVDSYPDYVLIDPNGKVIIGDLSNKHVDAALEHFVK